MMWFINRKIENQQVDATEQQLLEGESELPADFASFLDRFSKDSLYQMAHISFPLSGLPAYADSMTVAESNFKYYPEDWVMHKPFSGQNNFEQNFQIAGEGLVIERIGNKDGFSMQRRFAKLSNEWHLIYYAAINKGN